MIYTIVFEPKSIKEGKERKGNERKASGTDNNCLCGTIDPSRPVPRGQRAVNGYSYSLKLVSGE